MAFKASPSYLWRGRTGAWFFKLGIPHPLRKHYLNAVTGKPLAHIVRSLGTHKRAEAEKLKVPLLAHYRAEFKGLSGGVATRGINPAQLLVPEIREAMSQRDGGPDDFMLEVLQDQAEIVAKQIAAEEGPAAGSLAWKRMTKPDVKTLKEALASLQASSSCKGQTLETYSLSCRDLLSFLNLADCFPEDVTDERALAYVDDLNATSLSLSVKKKRLSGLNQIWDHMKRRGWPPNPWVGHVLTDPGKAKRGAEVVDGDDVGESVRPFTEAEIVRIFELPAPIDKRARTYTRSLFRELYALGFITGMRLNEIVSLRPMDISDLGDDWLLISIPKAVAKTAAGARKLPVCHPVAVAILKARIEAQTNPKARIFSECATGGSDNKPSWHVSKAMSRERLGPLKFTSEVNFHSTRRSFATLLEQESRADTLAQQRYMGHEISTVMHKVYSGGAGVVKLKQVVSNLKYSAPVEMALKLAQPAGKAAA